MNSPLPPIILLIAADTATDNTAIVAGVGFVLVLLQIGGYVFKRKGDADPVLRDIRDSLGRLEDKHDNTNHRLTVAEERMAHLNADLKEHVYQHTIEVGQQNEKIDGIFEALNGNGHPGIKENMRRMMDGLAVLHKQVEALNARMAEGRTHRRTPPEGT